MPDDLAKVREHTLVYQLNWILSLFEQSTHQSLYFSIEHWKVMNELFVFMPFQHFIHHRDGFPLQRLLVVFRLSLMCHLVVMGSLYAAESVGSLHQSVDYL